MSGKRTKARVGIALFGIGAVTAASILPGALAMADETSDVHTAVTRAVLSQGDANGEIDRSTLITQIQVDGSGQTSFSVPAPDGATPKDMDAFGGPTVEDGSAQYNLDVEGAQLMRTSQTYNTDDLPVTVEVAATLDGQPIDPADLAGQDGLATLTYSFENKTSEPTEVVYEDAEGETVTKTEEIPTPMAGSLSMVFDSSWTEVTSEESDTVAQNGSAGTTVGATVALMAPPAGEPEAEVTIEGRVESAVVPPADIKVAVIDPLTTGAGQSGEALAKTTGEGLTELYDGMELLASPTEGLGFLAAGLGTAVTGADKIANGVSDTLGPGISQLSEGLGTADAGANEIASGVVDTLGPGIHELRLKASVDGHASALGASHKLVDSVRGQDAYKSLLGGFDKVNDGLFTIQENQIKLDKKLGNPFDVIPMTPAGPDLSNATIAGGLATVVFGIPGTPITGLTNPNCDLADPTDPANSCGAAQVLDLMVGGAKKANTGLSQLVPPDCEANLAKCSPATGGHSPGGAALAQLLWQIQSNPASAVPDVGYTGGPKGFIGTDTFGPGGDFQGKSVTNIINSVVKPPNAPLDCSLAPQGDGSWKPPSATCVAVWQGAYGPGWEAVVGVFNLAKIEAQFAFGLGQAMGTGDKTDGSDSAEGTLRKGLFVIAGGTGKVRSGLVGDDPKGWPTGCLGPAGKDVPGIFQDEYGCHLVAADLGLALLGGEFTATNVLNTLAVLGTKTDKNPGGQIPSGHPAYPKSLQFGECPGGGASSDEIEAHCSLGQVLSFLSAGIAGDKAKNQISEGKVDKRCPVVSRTPWDTPQDGTDSGVVPSAPNADKVEQYGATCAERALAQSLDRILLPSIGNGIQQQTLETIGSGQYTPNCDPNVTGTLTCALSVLDEGVNGSSATSLVNGTQALADGLVLLDAGGQLINVGVNGSSETSLVNGTRALADGLPAAEAGATAAANGVTQQMMPGVNSSVETANSSIAVLEALSVKANSGAGIPGGAAEGVDSNQGIYAFEFAGSGTAAEGSIGRFALATLLLLLAAGIGWFLSSRKSA